MGEPLSTAATAPTTTKSHSNPRRARRSSAKLAGVLVKVGEHERAKGIGDGLEFGQAFVRRAVQELPNLHPIDAFGRYQIPFHEVVVVG
jgi:hypothetical protein